MKFKVFVPFVALAVIILTVGVACGASGNTDNSQNSQQNSQNQQSQATLPPVDDDAPAYFTEEFDNDNLDLWSYFLTAGDEDDVTTEFGDGKLTVDIQGTGVLYYVLYDPYTYTDVRIDARVTNRGQNTNNVSFICRYNGEDWYEISISNGGLYWIYYAKWDSSGVTASYGVMSEGGTDKIRTGKHTNDFAVTCIGNTINLYVNGVEEAEFVDRDYSLSEGQVGINVSSFNTYPIILDFDYITVSEP